MDLQLLYVFFLGTRISLLNFVGAILNFLFAHVDSWPKAGSTYLIESFVEIGMSFP